MIKKYYLLNILLLLCFILPAQEVFDLKRCIETGLERNYEIRMIRNEQQIADNNLTRGNAGYLPQVGLSAGYSGTVNNTEQRLSGSTVTQEETGVHNQTLNAGINMDWTVFDGFGIQSTYSKLKEYRQMGELSTRLTIENFIADVASEYYNYIQQTIRMNILQSTVRLSKERVRIAEARYQIGASSRLDWQQAKVDFNSDSSRLVQQHEIVYKTRIRLNQLMALQELESSVVQDSIIDLTTLLERNITLNQLLERNTLLELSRKDRNISELDLKIAQSQNYPYLKVNAGYGYTQNLYATGTYDRQQNLGLNYGITLGYNLFDGGNRKRKQKNTRLEIQNKGLAYEQLELSLRGDFSTMWMAYQNNTDLRILEKENLQVAKEAYEIAIDRYKLGDLSGLELREIQNRLLEAEERLVQAQYNTKLCEISLLQISGQILTYLE